MTNLIQENNNVKPHVMYWLWFDILLHNMHCACFICNVWFCYSVRESFCANFLEAWFATWNASMKLITELDWLYHSGQKNLSKVMCLRKGSWMKLDLDTTTTSKITTTSRKRDWKFKYIREKRQQNCFNCGHCSSFVPTWPEQKVY